MSYYLPITVIALSLTLLAGCTGSRDPLSSEPGPNEPLSSEPGPNKPTENEPPVPYKFLGIAEDETSNEGPVGLIGGQPIRVSNVSAVREVPYSEYQTAKDASKIVAEQSHNNFVYWAVKEERDVQFENASALVTVLERFKSRLK